jgi:hypothetical protein
VSDDIFVITFSDLYDLSILDMLDISLIHLLHIVSPQKLAFSIYSIYVLHVSKNIWHFACSHMQQQTLHRKGKVSPSFIDLQMATRANITLARKDVVVYFIKAMSRYKDKEMLVVPLNMSNHWVLLSISTKYDQFWYCDSFRSIDSKIGDRFTDDFSDGMSVLDE